MESGRSLVVISALLYVIRLNLGRGDVTVVYAHPAVATLVIDMVVVKERHAVDPGRISKHLVAVKAVLVSVAGAHHQPEKISEKVHLRPYRLYGVIQRGVGVLFKQYFTVDVPAPYDVFRHLGRHGIRQPRARGKGLGALGVLPLLLAAARRRLCVGYLGRARKHEQNHGGNTPKPGRARITAIRYDS